MCMKDKVRMTPLWLRITIGSMVTVVVTTVTISFSLADKYNNVTGSIKAVDSKVEGLTDLAKSQKNRVDKLEDSTQADHDNLIEFSTNQHHILRSLEEIKTMVREKQIN